MVPLATKQPESKPNSQPRQQLEARNLILRSKILMYPQSPTVTQCSCVIVQVHKAVMISDDDMMIDRCNRSLQTSPQPGWEKPRRPQDLTAHDMISHELNLSTAHSISDDVKTCHVCSTQRQSQGFYRSTGSMIICLVTCACYACPILKIT